MLILILNNGAALGISCLLNVLLFICTIKYTPPSMHAYAIILRASCGLDIFNEIINFCGSAVYIPYDGESADIGV